MVDPTPHTQMQLKSELERVATQYGGGPGVDMTKFPTFKFEGKKKKIKLKFSKQQNN